MAFRPDEQFVVDSLIDFLGGPDCVTAWQGEDPPDAYLKVGTQIAALEVTRLSPVSFSYDGSVENRTTQDSFAEELCDELDRKLGALVPKDRVICLTLHVPVVNARRFKKEANRMVQAVLAPCPEVGANSTHQVAGDEVSVDILRERKFSHKKIIGVVVNKHANADILANAKVILCGRLAAKREKCRNVKAADSKWLALLNDYWLADWRTYTAALAAYEASHGFARIYIVLHSGYVHEIFPCDGELRNVQISS